MNLTDSITNSLHLLLATYRTIIDVAMDTI